MATSNNPFGSTITAEDIVDTLSFFDTWEERYKYIIDLGKELPKLDDSFKDEEHIVKGCQSQVWINAEYDGDNLWFDADSDAFIVKGLLGVVLAAYNGKAPAVINDFDIESYFDSLGLLNHLSPTRGNGLRSMVGRIKALAQEIA